MFLSPFHKYGCFTSCALFLSLIWISSLSDEHCLEPLKKMHVSRPLTTQAQLHVPEAKVNTEMCTTRLPSTTGQNRKARKMLLQLQALCGFCFDKQVPIAWHTCKPSSWIGSKCFEGSASLAEIRSTNLGGWSLRWCVYSFDLLRLPIEGFGS